MRSICASSACPRASAQVVYRRGVNPPGDRASMWILYDQQPVPPRGTREIDRFAARTARRLDRTQVRRIRRGADAGEQRGDTEMYGLDLEPVGVEALPGHAWERSGLRPAPARTCCSICCNTGPGRQRRRSTAAARTVPGASDDLRFAVVSLVWWKPCAGRIVVTVSKFSAGELKWARRWRAEGIGAGPGRGRSSCARPVRWIDRLGVTSLPCAGRGRASPAKPRSFRWRRVRACRWATRLQSPRLRRWLNAGVQRR